MSQWEHERKDGYLSAMKTLHARVAADIQAKRGDIRPARTIYAYYDSAKIRIMRTAITLWRKAS